MRDDDRRRFPLARSAALVGAAGVPLLVAGMLAHSTQLCVIGAVIAGGAALLHVVLLLAGR